MRIYFSCNWINEYSGYQEDSLIYLTGTKGYLEKKFN